jgi:hypothetical protein
MNNTKDLFKKYLSYVIMAAVGWFTLTAIVAVIIGSFDLFGNMLGAGFVIFEIALLSVNFLEKSGKEDKIEQKNRLFITFVVSFIAFLIVLVGMMQSWISLGYKIGSNTVGFEITFITGVLVLIYFAVSEALARFASSENNLYSSLFLTSFISSGILLLLTVPIIVFKISPNDVLNKSLTIFAILWMSSSFVLPILERVSEAGKHKLLPSPVEGHNTDALAKLHKIYKEGGLTEDEYNTKKATILKNI